VSGNSILIFVFACFAIGLPIIAMDNNRFERNSVHECTGACYAEWKAATGGIVAVAEAQAVARAAASPVERGKEAFVGCVACHGASGQGGVGPRLAGKNATEVAAALQQYRDGETRGGQSSLMWSQAAGLSDDDIANLAAFVETL